MKTKTPKIKTPKPKTIRDLWKPIPRSAAMRRRFAEIDALLARKGLK